MRPYRFKLNPNHHFAQDLVYAGLGNVSGGLEFFDSGRNRYTGDLENMEASDWQYSSFLKRPVLEFGGTDEIVNLGTGLLDMPGDTQPFTISWWEYFNVVTAYPGICAFQPGGGTYKCIFLRSTAGSYGGITCGTSVSFGANFRSLPHPVQGEWHHFCIFASAGPSSFTSGDWTAFYDTDYYVAENQAALGANTTETNMIGWDGGDHFVNGFVVDLMIWKRLLPFEEALKLPDPDNYMLSGFIEKVPETKRFFFKEEPPTAVRPVQAPKKRHATRPHRFRINPDHPLAQGLAFAGFGNLAGSGNYFESSVYNQFGETGAATWSHAIGRAGPDYAGSARSRVEYYDGLEYNEATFMSMAMWYDCDAPRPSGNDYLFGQYDFAGAAREWAIVGRSGNGNIDAIFSDNGVQNGFLIPSSGVQLVTGLQHICFVQVGAAPSNYTWDVYINGVRTDIAESVIYKPGNNNSFLTVGGLDGSNYASGRIYDPVIYSRTIMASEVEQLADPDNHMLSGLIESVPETKHFFIGAVGPPPQAVTGIFESLVIGV